MSRTTVAPIVEVGLLGLLCLALGCNKKEPDAPRVPTSGGQTVTISHDASVPDAGRPRPTDEDGGITPLPTECKTFAAADASGESPTTGRFLNAVDEPPDLRVTRSEATWEPTCGRPTIRIALSDGKCPSGNGHELRFLFDATDIDNGLIKVGQNVIEPEVESRSIRIRYARPRTLKPSGEWGTCAEGASGAITLRDTRLGTDLSSHFEGQFQIMLPPCDGSDNEILALQGSFDAQLKRGLEMACPL